MSSVFVLWNLMQNWVFYACPYFWKFLPECTVQEINFEDKFKSELHGEVSLPYVLDLIFQINRIVPLLWHCATLQLLLVQLQNYIPITDLATSHSRPLSNDSACHKLWEVYPPILQLKSRSWEQSVGWGKVCAIFGACAWCWALEHVI